MQQIMKVPVSSLQLNTGQIDGVPKNPRFIKDTRFNQLVQSLHERPRMTEIKPLWVYKWVVISGNMRLRAVRELKWKEVPVIVLPEDTSVEDLCAYAILDNTHYGDHDWDALANEWSDKPLADWGVHKDYVAYDPNLTPEIGGGVITDADVLKAQGNLDNKFSGVHNELMTVICPECGNEFKINKYEKEKTGTDTTAPTEDRPS